MAKKKTPQRAIRSQKANLPDANLQMTYESTNFLERNCQIKRKIKIERIILKTIVFPQSGGENQGGTLSKGKAKIKKNPIK